MLYKRFYVEISQKYFESMGYHLPYKKWRWRFFPKCQIQMYLSLGSFHCIDRIKFWNFWDSFVGANFQIWVTGGQVWHGLYIFEWTCFPTRWKSFVYTRWLDVIIAGCMDTAKNHPNCLFCVFVCFELQKKRDCTLSNADGVLHVNLPQGCTSKSDACVSSLLMLSTTQRMVYRPLHVCISKMTTCFRVCSHSNDLWSQLEFSSPSWTSHLTVVPSVDMHMHASVELIMCESLCCIIEGGPWSIDTRKTYMCSKQCHLLLGC